MSKRKPLTVGPTTVTEGPTGGYSGPVKDPNMTKVEFLQRLAARWEDVGYFGTVEEAMIFVMAEDLVGEEKSEISEAETFLRRALKREEAGFDRREAWRLALAETLEKKIAKWPEWLSHLAARELLNEYSPKLKDERGHKLQRQFNLDYDRDMIDAIAEDLKAQGISRGYRGEAEKMWAGLQHKSVNTLRGRKRPDRAPGHPLKRRGRPHRPEKV